MKRFSSVPRTAVAGLLFAVLGAIHLSPAFAQGPPRRGGPGSGGERFRQMEQEALAEAFVGITADGRAEEGLFPIRSTGVSTKSVKDVAIAFLAGLTEEQRRITTFPVEDDEWRRWANQHPLIRQGVSFEDMTETQRELAFALMASGLSAKGLKLSQDIMKLNETLAELTGKPEEYSRWMYHLTVMGEPSDTEPWGWQFDGHHCIINYFVLGDQVVMTPHFVGSEPVRAESGIYEGTVVLQEEQDAGLAFARSLTDVQRAKAVLQSEKDGNNSQAEAFHDNLILDFAGLPVSELEGTQKQAFLKLLNLWISNQKEGHAVVKMSEIEQHLDRTFFAWIGSMDEGGVFYYRIHSPVVLIEFDHQRPIALGRSGEATRQHIHAVIRTPNGNDFGKDLLRQHLAEHPH